MNTKTFIVLMALVLSGCGQATPAVGLIQTAIAQTQTAQPVLAMTNTLEATESESPTNTPQATDTPSPTDTPRPSNTPKPTPTETPTQSIEQIQQDFINLIIDVLEKGEGISEDIESVTMVRFNPDGIFEIEVKNVWISRDHQPGVSFSIISYLANGFKDWPEENATILSGGQPFAVHITTYATDGDYRFQSVTDFATLKLLGNRQISYEEWVAAANAGFR